jgi:branched-chain amino acid aminotransferase
MLDYPAYADGVRCTVKDLNVSILDLGFIHSDATYDVIAVKNGIIQNLDAHLLRFQSSCSGWRLECPDMDELTAVCVSLVDRSPNKDLLIWICSTRGIPSTGNPRALDKCSGRFMAYAKPYFGFNPINSATVCIAKNVFRNDSFDQTMKNFAWQDLSLAQWEAIDRGFDTAVLLNRNGCLAEGPGFNAAVIKEGEILAPAYTRLQGTVMDRVKKICDRNSIKFTYTIVPRNELNYIDAMFLTSTAGNVIPVTKLEDRHFEENEILKWLMNTI